MADEIRPALTSEWWARLARSVEIAGMPNILDRPILTGDWAVVVALANWSLSDDDPRKITHDDIHLLEGAASVMRAEADDEWPLVERLAAKLAALLPPDE